MEDFLRLVQDQIEKAIEERRRDPEFQARLKKLITENREMLIRLESWIEEP